MTHLRSKRNSLKIFFHKFSSLILALAFCFLSLGFLFSLGKIKIIPRHNSYVFHLPVTKVLQDKSGNKIFVKLASSQREQEVGLSQTPALRIYQENGKIFTEGLLFIFDRAQVLTFWMKDMKFDLDLVWLNDQGEGDKMPNGKLKVVHLAKNVSKDSYHKENPSLSTLYQNPGDKLAKYVLEISAGLSEKIDLQVGDEISLQGLR